MQPNALPLSRTPSPRPGENNAPARPTSLASSNAQASSPSSLGEVQDTLDQASTLLYTSRPKEALLLLRTQANSPQAQRSFAFQWYLGQAYKSAVDELVAANRLGAFLVTPDATGNWLNPTIRSERLTCYIGMIASYGRFLHILQDPSQSARFIERNSEQDLTQKLFGARTGMYHAQLEVRGLFNQLGQINQNKASQAFVQESLANGRFTEEDDLVRSFREVEADPLYHAVVDATAPINQAVQASGHIPQFVWHNLAQASMQKISQLPELEIARPFLLPWPILPMMPLG